MYRYTKLLWMSNIFAVSQRFDLSVSNGIHATMMHWLFVGSVEFFRDFSPQMLTVFSPRSCLSPPFV